MRRAEALTTPITTDRPRLTHDMNQPEVSSLHQSGAAVEDYSLLQGWHGTVRASRVAPLCNSHQAGVHVFISIKGARATPLPVY